MEKKNQLIPELNQAVPPVPEPPKKKNKPSGCLTVLLICLGVFGVSLLLMYFYIRSQLPNVDDLRSQASQFETMRIMDRQGNQLYEVVPSDAGRRDHVSLDEISSYVIAAVIAVEDQDYYSHPGFDLSAIIRAVFQNSEAGQMVSGASTITQQLARALLLSPEERTERSLLRKIREVLLAVEITRRYTKDEILEIYLNENYFGNHAYGIEAAAQTYFRRSAKNLDLGQAAFLAGLIQAPGYYDILNHREETLERMNTVLLLTYNLSRRDGGISIRGGRETVTVDAVMVDSAVRSISAYKFSPESFDIMYPHWVNYVYALLEEQYGAEALYRSGWTVYTTIDPDLQESALRILKSYSEALGASHNAYNGAVIAIAPETGDIIAYVGSPDFYDTEHSGQVNMAASPRQPGSAIKPLIYAAAFEKGWTPASLIWDVPTEFSPTGKDEDLRYSQPYVPTNYDGKSHGPVLVRRALASSLNVPAVKALQYVGIYDNPDTEREDGFIAFAKRLHVDSLDKAGWGLSIALGGGEVTLTELTAAYSVFANNGKYIPPRAVLEIRDHNGNIVYAAEDPLYENALREEYAFQINSILSDDNARALAFGTGSVLNLSYPAAVKTGTTNDYRDNWAVGYNPKIAVGVWIGNADNTPMLNSTGVTGAAPIWHELMERAAEIYPEIARVDFTRPAGIMEQTVCAASGTLPGDSCRAVKTEYFANDRGPLDGGYDLIGHRYIDTWSGRPSSVECASGGESVLSLRVTDEAAIRWLSETAEGAAWLQTNGVTDAVFVTSDEVLYPPCGQPTVEIYSPQTNMVIDSSSVEIFGIAYAAEAVSGCSLSYSSSADSDARYVIDGALNCSDPSPRKLADWYLGNLADGTYTLYLRIDKSAGRYYEHSVPVHLQRGSDDASHGGTQFYFSPEFFGNYEEEENG